MEAGMMDHLLPKAGWTRNSAGVGYIVRLAVNLEHDLLRVDGTRDQLHVDTGIPGAEAKFNQRVAPLGLQGAGPGRWAYAGELELTWKVTHGTCPSDAPPVPGVVEVGARVPGEPPSLPIKLVMSKQGCFAEEHPELIAVSPDGKHIGAIAHGFAGEWFEDYPMGIAGVAAVAEGAFNNAGLVHHRKGEYARGAQLFQKAARADPTSKAAAYNLACALARLGDAGAEAALARAIALGGEETRQKARKDPDFAAVSAKPWFTALVKSP
jgi:hypothetical protein